MAHAPWNWLGFLLRYGLVLALALSLWPSLRLAYARLVVNGCNVAFELLEADPETHVTLRSLERYHAERAKLPAPGTSTFIKLSVDTLTPFWPWAAAIPRLTWRNRLILLLAGLGVLYLVQVGLLLTLFRHAMATAYLNPALDDIRHLAPFNYATIDIKFYKETVRQFWVNVGYYWAGPGVGLGLGAWLLSRQKRSHDGNENPLPDPSRKP